MYFHSDDLEFGNRSKGLTGSTGAGTGPWRLRLDSGLGEHSIRGRRSAAEGARDEVDLPRDGVRQEDRSLTRARSTSLRASSRRAGMPMIGARVAGVGRGRDRLSVLGRTRVRCRLLSGVVQSRTSPCCRLARKLPGEVALKAPLGPAMDGVSDRIAAAETGGFPERLPFGLALPLEPPLPRRDRDPLRADLATRECGHGACGLYGGRLASLAQTPPGLAFRANAERPRALGARL